MSSQTDVDANITKLVNSVIEAYKEIKLNDFFACVVKLMEGAEAIPALSGADKKKVVKGVLNQIVEKINIPNPKEKEIIVFLINSGLVDLIIDGIVKLTKEGCKINVQEIVAKCNSCCKCGKCCIM